MENELTYMILATIIGVAIGAFFKQVLYLFSSKGTRDRIKKYKQTKNYFKKEYKMQCRKLDICQKKLTEQSLELADTQKTLWKLLKGRLTYSIENSSKSNKLMKNLILAFDYLIENPTSEVNGYESLKMEGSGVDSHGWDMLSKAKFFKETDDKGYALTIDGENIFNHYKAYKINQNGSLSKA